MYGTRGSHERRAGAGEAACGVSGYVLSSQVSGKSRSERDQGIESKTGVSRGRVFVHCDCVPQWKNYSENKTFVFEGDEKERGRERRRLATNATRARPPYVRVNAFRGVIADDREAALEHPTQSPPHRDGQSHSTATWREHAKFE